jgi:outer membrane protein assembly factor BamB
MHVNKIVSSSVVILLIAVLFAGAVTVPAAAQTDAMQYRYNAAHTGDYSPVAGPVASNGQLKWNYTTGSSVDSSPAVANGIVYVGSYDNNVYALYANNGTKLWNYTTGGPVFSSPAVVNGVVYVGSYDYNLYALNATTGAKLWNYTTGDYVWSSPAVVNGVVYAGSNDNNVYALYANNGTKLWNCTTKGIVQSSPAVVNGVVYVGSRYPDNNVYALNANNGTKLWNYTTGSMVESSPAVVNGVVYVGSDDGNLYAVGNESVSTPTTLTATAPSTASVNQNFMINGTLNATDGAPIAGATIQLQKNVSGTWTNVTGKTNTTTSIGAYSISTSEPAAGTYQYRTYYAGNDTLANATSNVVKVSVTAPATTGNLLLNTHLVSTTTGSPPKMVTTYTFSGQLMTTSWTPVANAAITLQSSSDKVHWSAFASPVKTNAQGAYTFKGTLKPGSYYFRTFFAGTSSTGPTASRIVKVVLSLNGSSSVSTVVA